MEGGHPGDDVVVVVTIISSARKSIGKGGVDKSPNCFKFLALGLVEVARRRANADSRRCIDCRADDCRRHYFRFAIVTQPMRMLAGSALGS